MSILSNGILKIVALSSACCAFWIGFVVMADDAKIQASEQIASNSIEELSVKETQRALSMLGYNPGPVDGVIGTKTTDAVRSLQKDNGLDITGEVDHATRQILYRGVLMYAALSGETDRVKKLLSLLGANDGDKYSINKALMLALRKACHKKVAMTFSATPFVTGFGSKSKPAPMQYQGHAENSPNNEKGSDYYKIVELLLSKGADPNSMVIRGYRKGGVSGQFLSFGSIGTIVDLDGGEMREGDLTPLKLAELEQASDMAELLKRYETR